MNGEVRIDEEVKGSVFKSGAFTKNLETSIAPGTSDIELELINPDEEVFWLVSMASLSEHDGESKEHLRRTQRRISAFPDGAVVLAREGEPVGLEDVSELEKTKSPCGFRFKTPYLEISDTALNDAGLGRGSPLLLLENDAPLKPHATVREFQGRCAGAFGHTGRFIWFSPTGKKQAAETNQYTLVLNPNFPAPRAGKPPIYWVYPGT